MANIGFIGLGNMGGPMAINLVKAGHTVSVFDLNKAALDEVVKHTAIAAEQVSDCVKDADFVVSMLPAGQHVKSLYLDENNGLIHHLKTDTVVIDSSTIDTATAQYVGAELAKKGIQFVDAPVSGGTAGAGAGTLTFIVGAQSETFRQVEPILAAMGKNIFHAGEVGAGQIAKICNNMLLSVLMLGTSEALQLAINNGLDPKVMSQIMLQSSGRNWTLENYNPCPDVMENVPSSNGYQGGFMVDLMRKDLGLAMETAMQSNSVTPMGALAQSFYGLHSANGMGSKDFSSIFEMFSKHRQEGK